MHSRFAGSLLAVAVCAANSAFGQSVTVQTGEHATFTRLALQFPAPVPWSTSETEAGYEVLFKSSNLSLDLSNSFRLIPRDRVEDLSWDTENRVLRIASTCQCHLRAFELPGNVLVLDVRSGPDPDAPVAAARPSEADTQTAMPMTPPAGPALPLLLSSEQILTARFENRPGSDDAPSSDPTSRQGLSEESLLASISAAASEGLLSLNAQDGPDVSGATGGEATGGRSALLDHVNSRSASTQPQTASEAAESARLANCPAAAEVQISKWGSGSAQQILAQGPNTIFDSRGRLDTAQVISHAKSLLYLGFGAEARMHLSLLDRRSAETDMLREMSFLVDGQHERASPRLDAMLGCTGDAQLWGILAAEKKPPNTELDTDALYSSFLSLPSHLQKLLAAHMVRKLRDFGETDAAATLLAAIDRMPGTASADLRMLEGLDAIADGDVSGGEVALGEVIFEQSDTSPQALLHLIQAREARGTTVPEDILVLAEGIAQELGKSPMAIALTAASAMAHASDGRFENAFAHLQDLSEADQAIRDDLQSDLTVKLAATAPDSVFLILSFKHGLTVPQPAMPPAAALAMANRLLSLGFVEEARRLAADLPRSAESVRLRAEIALARGAAQDAVDLLADANDTAAHALRASALRTLNAQPEAVELFNSLGAREAAQATAWESGEDPLISKFGSDDERTLIETIAGTDGAPALDERALIARTDVTQSNLEDLLLGTAGFREAARDLLNAQEVGNQ